MEGDQRGITLEVELKLDGTAISRLTREAVGGSQAFEVGNPESAGGFAFVLLLAILSLCAGVDAFLARLFGHPFIAESFEV